jgi:hypothetical protein
LLVENAANIFYHRNLIWYVVRQVPVERIVYRDKIVEVRFILLFYFVDA